MDDAEERKLLSIANNKIGEDRFKKLKFLTTPLLHTRTGELRNADTDTVIGIYELLTDEHGGDFRKAASEVYVMLGIIGLQRFKSMSSSQASEIQQNKEFQWRVKLIECSDRAAKQKKDSEMIDRLFKSCDMEISRDSITSPLMLFDHMIDQGLFQPGREEDLETVKDILSFCKSMC